MKSDLKYQPFVILGTARTGSTMLWSYLNSHPGILCLRGVFGSVNKINFGEYYRQLPAEYHSSELIQLRNQRPAIFIENYIWKSYTIPYKAVGFKYFYSHGKHLELNNSVIEYIFSNTDVKILHIKRDNLLAALFSYKRAVAQNQWLSANEAFHIYITKQECIRYFDSTISEQEKYDSLFKKRILTINYNMILYNTDYVLRNTLNFLGLENAKLYTKTVENKKVNLSHHIINYNELKEHFSNTIYSTYFNY